MSRPTACSGGPNGVVFLVTPEKYQMTELPPYYRLAQRYSIPVLFAMNKCEETDVLTDYATQLGTRYGYDVNGLNPAGEKSRLFAIPRDDSTWIPPAGADLTALGESIAALAKIDPDAREFGLFNRSNDLNSRLADQVIAPLRAARREADQLIDALRTMESPEPGVDVNPITQQLQRRLQRRSVLYLMGPGRILERVRQVPGALVRLPRTFWDTVFRGKKIALSNPQPADADSQVPDFRANLVDQFAVVQSRMDDTVRSGALASRWVVDRAETFAAAHIPADDAGKIVDEELSGLRFWLENRWNANPRDTLLILRLLRHLPGGQKLVRYFEATPYLLALVVATHHALFGHVDLMVIGGYSLATWLTEKLSNEVTNNVRDTNRRIGERFARLAHRQIAMLGDWLDQQAPSARRLDHLDQTATEMTGDGDDSKGDP